LQRKKKSLGFVILKIEKREPGGSGSQQTTFEKDEKMYNGQITAMDADEAYVGDIASQSFDFGFSMVPNTFKAKDSHPDFHVEVRSPRGRTIRIGSAWKATSQRGNEYFQIALNVQGVGQIRVNAVTDPELEEGSFRIIPLAA
jgi:uncharacterized protein (DUF736 family)